MLITEKLYELFKNQIVHENQNSIIYKNVSAYLQRIGLKNLGAFFTKQSSDETGHRDLLIDYLTDINVPVLIDDVPYVNVDMSSLSSIAHFALNREIETTNRIKAMCVQALDDEDILTYEFLLSFIKEQREEIAVSQDLVDNIDDMNSDMGLIRLFDQNYEF